MPIVRRYEFRGLNLRANDFNRDVNYASDLQNVELDSSRNLRKRKGYEQDTPSLFNSLAIVPYRKNDEIMAMTPTGIRRRNIGVDFEAIRYAGGQTSIPWSSAPSFAEYNGVLYFTDTDGNNFPHKYDGVYTYRAGCPPVRVDTVSKTNGSHYVRVWLSVKDAQGNETQGDYFQIDEVAPGTNLSFRIYTFNAAVTDPEFGFPNKSFEPVLASTQTIGGGNDIINIVSGQNSYNTGDFIYCFTDSNGVVPVEILNITATTIQVDPAPLDALGITHGFSSLSGADPNSPASFYPGQVSIKLAISDKPTTGYRVSDAGSLLHHKGSFYFFNRLVSNVVNLQQLPLMDDVYDTTVIKGVPPKAKFLTLYNNIMVMAGANQEDQSIDPAVRPSIQDTIYWSDLSVGSNVEVFAAFDQEVVGRTDEGGITGLFASVDQLTVFKERQVYYIQGVLTGGNFRIRNALTGEVGCVSHQSIKEYRGGCVFMSNRGVHYARGSDLLELSDVIEPLFTQDTTGLDLTDSKTALDQFNEKLYMYIPSTTDPANDIVLVYDYYWKEWFKHNNFDARGGFMVYKDILYHATFDPLTGELFRRRDEFLDGTSDSPVDSYWASGWDHHGAPSLRKKFTNLLAVTEQPELNLLLRLQKNWDSTKDILSKTKQFKDRDLLFDLPAEQAKSMRYIFQNINPSEDMYLSGYELEFEMVQERFKG